MSNILLTKEMQEYLQTVWQKISVVTISKLPGLTKFVFLFPMCYIWQMCFWTKRVEMLFY